MAGHKALSHARTAMSTAKTQPSSHTTQADKHKYFNPVRNDIRSTMLIASGIRHFQKKKSKARESSYKYPEGIKSLSPALP
jgi:hypothetical protein